MPKPYHRNPRQIKKARFDRLNDTLTRLGDLGGIVHNIRTDEIIGGNQRTAVFGQASEVQIIEQYDTPDEQGTVAHGFVVWQGKKYSYRQVDWNEETAAEANIAANIGAGEWSWEILANEWQPAELTEWGFDDSLLDNWRLDVASLGNFLESEEAEESRDSAPQIDRAGELRELWGVEPGQLWRLPSRTAGNEHRLICGDCTDAGVVAAVMGGDVPLLMVTDPPYGVEYDPEWRVASGVQHRTHGEKIEGDDRADWSDAWALFPGDVCYVWHAGRHAKTVAESLEECKLIPSYLIVWNKDLAVFGRGDYHHKHEPCWYAVRKGKKHNYIGGRQQTTVWDIPTIHSFANGHNEAEWGLVGHGSQKPLECMARPIRNHDAPIVYDPFGGSGTTMVACENLGRRCRMIELDPGYTAVILQRMSDAFGLTPELIETL